MVKALKTTKNSNKKTKTLSATEQEFASALSNELPMTLSTALTEKVAPVVVTEPVKREAKVKIAASAARKTPAIKSTEPIRNIRAFCSTYVRNLRRDAFGNPMTAIAAAFERAIRA